MNTFERTDLARLDTVTGATITSRAIRDHLIGALSDNLSGVNKQTNSAENCP